jgi:hypothetical protein
MLSIYAGAILTCLSPCTRDSLLNTWRYLCFVKIFIYKFLYLLVFYECLCYSDELKHPCIPEYTVLLFGLHSGILFVCFLLVNKWTSFEEKSFNYTFLIKW